jgi:hypothetical protein
MKACFAAKDPKWDCKKWISEGGLPKAEGPKSKGKPKAKRKG